MSNPFLNIGIGMMERGLLPDVLIRRCISSLCTQRLKTETAINDQVQKEKFFDFIRQMDAGPIALLPEKANEQHYELPPEFFELVLGKHRKYSSAFWATGTEYLEDAEKRALSLTCEHAELADGMDILELGCGWGSLSLWMAEHYPNSRITGVSNSAPQRQYILNQAHQRGLKNLHIITADMNQFDITTKFDRVVSVEMFEHIRNHRALMKNISRWLNPDGKFFMHIFVHRSLAYEFQTHGTSNWMGKYFFTGGIMPSDDLPLQFQDDLAFVTRWKWSGVHYEQTANAWLKNLDEKRDLAMPILIATYGKPNAKLWFNRWRVFFMACAELWGYAEGNEWWVSHYLFSNKPK